MSKYSSSSALAFFRFEPLSDGFVLEDRFSPSEETRLLLDLRHQQKRMGKIISK
jgi:hypothetical protein